MSRFALRVTIGVAFLFAVLPQAPGQDKPPADAKGKEPRAASAVPGEDYREFFKKPETAIEFWEAMKFEIEVGKFDLAAQHLKGLLAKKPADKDLLYMKDQKIGEYSGLTAILRLRNIKWSNDPATQEEAKKNVEQLITLTTEAIKRSLPSPELIAKHARNLAATEEERDYALRELYRAGPAAIPELLKALQETTGREHQKVLSALPLLNPDTVPPLAAALDGVSAELRIELIDVLERRRAASAAPFLWHLYGSAEQPEAVRRKATEALAYLLEIPAGNLPIAKAALTREANRYYDHQVKFPDPSRVVIWRWDAKQNKLVGLEVPPVTASQAEEYYGLLFAGQALEIDPTYLPAQVAYLSLVLDKSVEQSGIDKPLAGDVNRLLVTVNPDLVNAVLDRALSENRVRVIVAAARALGELAEARALRPVGGEQPALVRALNYANRRVQMAAANALLRIPQAAPIGAPRVVEVLRRAVAEPDGKAPKVLVGYANRDVSNAISDSLRKAGYDPVQAYSGRQAMLRLNEAADVDALLIYYALPDPGLPYLLGQLRADINVGRVPLLLVVPSETEESLRRERDRIDQELLLLARKRAVLRQERDRLEREAITASREQEVFLRRDLERIEAELRDAPRVKDEGLRQQRERAAAALRKEREARAASLRRERQRLDRELAVASPDQAAALRQARDRIDWDLLDVSRGHEDELRQERKRIDQALLSAPHDPEPSLRRFAENYRNVWVIPEPAALDSNQLKQALEARLDDVGNRPLTAAERTEYAEKSLHWLARIAEGEVAGYDARPAAKATLAVLSSAQLKDDALKDAIDAAGRLPAQVDDQRPQSALTAFLFQQNRPAALRARAARELVRNIQRHGVTLSEAEAQRLKDLALAPGMDATLQADLAVVVGSLRPNPRLTGERLRGFRPALPSGPVKEKPAEKPVEEKPKEKPEEKPPEKAGG